MSTPSSMKAIKVQEQGKAALVDTSIPKLRDDYILVKVHAVGLNPTDFKHIDYLPQKDATVGCDYAGEVVEVGKAVTKKFSKGDRVAGFVHGVSSKSTEDGAFSEYVAAKGDIQMKIPENISYEEAATLGVSITTVGQGLYQSLKLAYPTSPIKDKTPLLIYGGTTGTGLFAIQFAKLSGYEVVVTCSPKNFDLVKKYGADAAFDYSDADKCAKEVKDYTKGNLKYAFDCIAAGSSSKICADSLSSSGGEYSSLLPVSDFPRKDVNNRSTLAYTIENEAFNFAGHDIPASKEDFEEGKKFWELTTQLMQDGKIKVPPMQKGQSLKSVFDGLDQLRQGKVSGQKLVYTL